MKQNIAVRVGNSSALSMIVLNLFRSHGLEGGDEVAENARHATGDSNCLVVYRGSPDYMDKTKVYWGGEKNAIQINAATQMGELIALLEAPPEIVIVAAVREGATKMHDAVVSPDGLTLTVGCSTATFAKVKEIYETMLVNQKAK